MYTSIVCAFDGSELSTKALRHAMALADKFAAQLTALTVIEPIVVLSPGAQIAVMDPAGAASLEKSMHEGAKGILALAEDLAREAGTAIKTVELAGHPGAEGILEMAMDQNADLIVMGAQSRRGLGRLLLGSQANEVLALAKIPVLIVR